MAATSTSRKGLTFGTVSPEVTNRPQTRIRTLTQQEPTDCESIHRFDVGSVGSIAVSGQFCRASSDITTQSRMRFRPTGECAMIQINNSQ